MPDTTPEATPSPELRRSLLALSEKHGVPVIDLAALTLQLDDLALLPQEVARRHGVLPLLVKDDALFLGMAAPGDRRAIDEVEFVSGKKVLPFVCEAEQLAATLDAVYERHAQGDRAWIGPRATNLPPPSTDVESTVMISTPPFAEPSAPPPVPPMPVPAVPRAVPPPLPPALRSRSATLLQGRPTVPVSAPEPVASAPVIPVPEVGGTRSLQRPATRLRSDPPVAPSVLPSALPPMISPSGRSVAIVVGDGGERAMLRGAFADLGHDVTEVPVDSALAQLVARPPDLVVVDLQLPDGAGLALCAELHGAKTSRPIPVLALVSDPRAWRLIDDLRAACGVRGVLSRPIRAVEVLTRAETVFEDRAEAAPDDNLPPQAEVSLQSGMEAYQRGAVDEAVRFIEQGLRSAPGSFRLHYHHGLLLGRTGALHRAIRALEQCLALHERYFPALRNLAVLYERAGFRRSALEAWERAHAAAPDEAARAQIKERVLSLL